MTPKSPIEAVIFDCDGTLVDSEVLGAKAMWEVAHGYGCTLAFDDFIHHYTGRTMALNIETLNQYSAVPMPQSFATEVRTAMAEKFRFELTEMEGAKSLLTELQTRGIPMAVATNGPRAKAEQTLTLTGLRHFFGTQGAVDDRLFCAYEHGVFKPDPELFLLAAQHLQVAPQRCAAVEDSVSGLAAAVAAKMQTFCVAPLAGLSQQFDPVPVHLPRLADLLDYL